MESRTTGLSGSVPAGSSQRRESIDHNPADLSERVKLIAFYLPQFHRIRENSEWWGPGFTEWTNVAKARPNFDGHYQPHIPRELGFYDLSNPDVMREQVELARNYGVYGFCFYYYWFSGRRILERPVDNFIKSDIDFPFCLCWANESWTRTWDGENQKILLEQRYEAGDDERFLKSVLPFLTNRLHIAVDGKPMLLVYRIKQPPDPVGSIAEWRLAARSAGLAGLHIAVVDAYDVKDPDEVGAVQTPWWSSHCINIMACSINSIPHLLSLILTIPEPWWITSR